MKRTLLSLLFLLAASLVTLASTPFAQDAEQMPRPPLKGYYTHGKLRSVTAEIS